MLRETKAKDNQMLYWASGLDSPLSSLKQHIAIYSGRGHDSLDGNDSLVATFLESVESWLRGEMIDFIGNSFRSESNCHFWIYLSSTITTIGVLQIGLSSQSISSRSRWIRAMTNRSRQPIRLLTFSVEKGFSDTVNCCNAVTF
jgi:hypothetical protein